jgi:hypothetical protein
MAGGNWWRANEIRHLTRKIATRDRCHDRAGIGPAIATGLAEAGAGKSFVRSGRQQGREDTAEAIADRCGTLSEADTPGLHRCNKLWSEGLTDWLLRLEILPLNPLKKNHMSGCSAFCTLFIREKPCRVCSELIMG